MVTYLFDNRRPGLNRLTRLLHSCCWCEGGMCGSQGLLDAHHWGCDGRGRGVARWQ